MGDLIICTGLIRHLAKVYDMVVIPVKYHNLQSSNYLFHDLPNVFIRAVEDDEDADQFCNNVFKGEKLYLGHFNQPFDAQKFDAEFYRQANLSFDLRWSGFHVERKKEMEVELPLSTPGKFAFVHEDLARGYAIRDDLIDWEEYHPHPSVSLNLFAYIPVLQAATEVHCINSSFALLVDSIDLPQNPKLFLHLYSRPGGEVPTFRKEWVRLV